MPLSSTDIDGKFYGDRPRGSPPSELNARGVAKCSDFGPIEGYVSETVQDNSVASGAHCVKWLKMSL